MIFRDLSGVGYFDTRPRSGGRSWPANRPEPRPAAPPAQFRLTTAAALDAARGTLGPAGGSGPVDLDALKPGVSVLHPEYGLGRIVSVDGAGPNRKGRVAFAVGPERTFVLAKSPLRPVGQDRAGWASRPANWRQTCLTTESSSQSRRRAAIMSRLGVNIDHIATLRQARGGAEPDPVWGGRPG